MSNFETTVELSLNESEKDTATFSSDWDTLPVLNLANTEIAKSWKSVILRWSYPHDDLTLVIETPFTQQREHYSISMDTEGWRGETTRVQRIIDGKEIDLKLCESPLIQECDGNYQIILKFYASPDSVYLNIIKYHVIPK